MQKVYCFRKNQELSITLPNPNENIFDTIKWGRFEEFFTPAFWRAQAWFFELRNDAALTYQLGETFKEEVIACLLGGHGISSEMGIAKFNQFKENKIFTLNNVSLESIEEIMHAPIYMDGKYKKYRFAKQKSKYIYDALIKVDNVNEKEKSDLELRNFLLGIDGIGLKTASWIVRNYRKSNNVAILDIHLYRAGLLVGIFNEKDRIEKNYLVMEEKFLLFCKYLGVQASKLDAVIWRVMKELNTFALSKIK